MPRHSKEFFDNGKRCEEERINKYLADAGVCSRREADDFIAAGRVKINGQKAVNGSKVHDGDRVFLDSDEIKKDTHLVVIALNKPDGIVCTSDRREPNNIIDYIKYDSRIFPIGRLDKDSEGLILLTNDGEIVNKILRAGNHHEKEYVVTVNKPITDEFLKGMASGVHILDTVTKPCHVEAIDRTSFRIILTQGLNRQIRRMCEHFDYKVMTLTRVRIMNIRLGRLKVGGWRNLTEEELNGLNEEIELSGNEAHINASKNHTSQNDSADIRNRGAGEEKGSYIGLPKGAVARQARKKPYYNALFAEKNAQKKKDEEKKHEKLLHASISKNEIDELRRKRKSSSDWRKRLSGSVTDNEEKSKNINRKNSEFKGHSKIGKNEEVNDYQKNRRMKEEKNKPWLKMNTHNRHKK
jgi:23S rRNA pseudouridine2604 synthase